MKPIEERNLDLMLGEALGNKTPPERSDAILRAVLDARDRGVIPAYEQRETNEGVAPRAPAGRLDQPDAMPAFAEASHLHLVTESPRRRRLGIGIAAASIVAGVALMLWPTENELPPGVMVAQGAVLNTGKGWIELEKGWLVATARAGSIRAGEARIDAVSGKVVIKQGEIPNDDEVEAMAAWLAEQGVEANMLKDSTRWLKRGALALAVVSGTALCDGVLVSADESKDAKDAPAQDQSIGTAEAPVIVRSIADIEALPKGVQYVKCENITDAHLDFLTKHESIIGLDLQNCGQVTPVGMTYLRKFKNLYSLDVRGCDIVRVDGVRVDGANNYRQDGLNIVSELPALRSLNLNARQFIFQLPYVDKGDLGTLDRIWTSDASNLAGKLGEGRVKSMDRLMIAKAGNLSDQDFEKIAQFLPCVTALECSSAWDPVAKANVPSTATDTAFKHIASLPKLGYLDVGVLQPSDAGYAYLASAATPLKTLKCCISSDVSVNQIARLGTLVELESYPVGGVLLGKSLLSLRSLKNLVALRIPNTRFDDESLALLNDLPKLKELDISSTPISGYGFKRLTDNTALKTLRLENCDNVASLEGIERLKALESLDISRCDTLPQATNPLEAIQRLPALKELRGVYLQDKNVEAGMQSLAKMTSLRKLTTQFNCNGRIPLALLSSLAALEELSLSNVRYEDLDVLKSFQELKSLYFYGHMRLADVETIAALPKLEQLNLSQVELRDARTEDEQKQFYNSLLEILKQTKTLKELDIRKQYRNLQAVAALQDALPNCVIK